MFKPPQELIWILGYFIKHNFQYCPLIFLWSRKINLNWLQDSVFTFCYRKLGAYTLMIQKRTCRNPSFCNSCSSMRGRQWIQICTSSVLWLISANRDNVERVRAIEKAGNQGKRQVVSRGVERQWQASEQPSEKEKPSFVLVADFCDSFPHNHDKTTEADNTPFASGIWGCRSWVTYPSAHRVEGSLYPKAWCPDGMLVALKGIWQWLEAFAAISF